MRDDYVRSVTVVEAIDGDTFRCDVDLGFYVRVRMSCRLAGLNAPELRDPGGPHVRTAIERVLLSAQAVVVRSVRPDKFAGRFDAEVLAYGVPGDDWPDSNSVNEWLLAERLAVPWDGRGPRPPVPWPPPSL